MNMSGTDVRKLRKKLGLNQAQFWAPIGVTQSGGSRYENERDMPKPVKKLIALVYVLPDEKAVTMLKKIRTQAQARA